MSDISEETILVTGALGFIGSCFVIQELHKGHKIIGFDNYSYAANEKNLRDVRYEKNLTLIRGDINDTKALDRVFQQHLISKVVHFAAESHVDRSIKAPDIFIKTNILGTYNLLNLCLKYWENDKLPKSFKFLHVSTDEVFGELGVDKNEMFSENTPYNPRSPYSASKAASDHLVRAWHYTFGLPVIITNCSNNFGPRQHNEKFIPQIILCALDNKPIPVYGNGNNIRDWIYVEDHTKGLALALTKGNVGETYLFGGESEITNIELVEKITSILDNMHPRKDNTPYLNQVKFVKDRKGHDYRYSINNSKAQTLLGFKNTKSFEENLINTINWYINEYF